MSGFQITGDLALNEDESDFVLLDGTEMVVQHLKIGAQIFRSGWRYDLRAGIPWLNEVLRKGAGEQVLRRVFYDYLIDTEGISDVKSISLRFDSVLRIMAVDFFATSELGDTISDTLEFEII